MPAPPAAVVHLFTDIEGSSRLWDEHPALMRLALAAHDAIVRDAVAAQHGTLVKSTGDGVHAAFDDPLAALQAVLALQRALTDPARTAGMPLAVRCGLHRGADEARDNDFYGPDVNRAARIAGAAHGGQMLLSQTVAEALADRLPEGVTLRNLGAVRLRDLARAEALHQVLAPPLRADFPPLRSLEATPNNLVQQVSRFIGRGDELGAVRRLLADNRLVTLFGPGGIGKTRLSVQLGAELIDEFRDGVWFVELAPLPPGDEGGRRVPLAVASALGLRESAGQPLADTLAQFVRERRLLLILDNCEHVHAAAAALAKRLLQASAGLRILASSREALHVGGEAVYPVPTLSVPEPSHEHPPEALMQHAAVRLFVDRASAVQPSFRLDADTAVAVADICHRLDGIPLAIELAAARARALPVQTMARRLVDSFRLVATQDETVAPRQRTLRMLIDWSHELLSAPERLLFRRLAVFAGGFTLEAAEAICSGDGLDQDEVLELLLQLADKSLLVCDDGGQRYRMLETIRLYAAERLVDAGDVAVRRRHLQHYLETAEQAHARASGPDQGAWLPELDRERGNLLAAHAFSLQLDDDPDAAMRLAFALRRYWFNLGLLTQRLDMMLAAVRRPGLSASRRAQGLADAGQVCSYMGRNAEALTYLQESVDIARTLGEHDRVAWALQPMGMAAIGLGDLALAQRCLSEAVVLARRLGGPFELAAALNALAQLERLEGRRDAARQLYEETLALARGAHLWEIVAVALLNLAMLGTQDELAPDGPGAVAACIAEAMLLSRDIGSKPLLLGVLDAATGLASRLGDGAAAAVWHGAARRLLRETGLQRDAADEAFLTPLLPLARASVPAEAWRAAEAQGEGDALAPTTERLAAWLGERQSARS